MRCARSAPFVLLVSMLIACAAGGVDTDLDNDNAAGAGGSAGLAVSAGSAGSAGKMAAAGSSGQTIAGAPATAGAAGSKAGAAGAKAAGSGGSVNMPAGSGGSPVTASGGASSTCAFAMEPEIDGCFTCWNGAATGGDCKSAFDACEADPECVAYGACFQGCIADTDEECDAQCGMSHPMGATAHQAVRDCVCNTACPTDCADACDQSRSLRRCNHDVCTEGSDLDAACSACAYSICAADNPDVPESGLCCTVDSWENDCVDEAMSTCGACPDAGACVHQECATGVALDAACSTCAATVCAKYPLCCSGIGRWDEPCVAEAAKCN